MAAHAWGVNRRCAVGSVIVALQCRGDLAAGGLDRRDGFGGFESLAEEFLKYFEGSAKGVFQNYKRLSIEQGVLEQFEANPLVTIVTMQPGCCFHIATRFLDDKMTT